MSESKAEQLDRVRSIVRRCESISKEDASLLEAEIVRRGKDLDRAIEIAEERKNILGCGNGSMHAEYFDHACGGHDAELNAMKGGVE